MYDQSISSSRIDGFALAALALLAFLTANLLFDIQGGKAETLPPSDTAYLFHTTASASTSDDTLDSTTSASTSQAEGEDAKTGIIPPYDHYTITQGPHGFSYGHMAIDLAAGRGTPVKSPITGVVTDLFIDQWGNPNLVIENQRFRVTLLHGEYTVKVGDQLEQGQQVGKESNLGYTTDMQGRSCLNRHCGYHTHLNVFDKRRQENVNPLKWLE